VRITPNRANVKLFAQLLATEVFYFQRLPLGVQTHSVKYPTHSVIKHTPSACQNDENYKNKLVVESASSAKMGSENLIFPKWPAMSLSNGLP